MKLKEFKKGVDTRLSKNFSSKEFDCKCSNPDCKKTYIDMDHVNKLQKKREKWNRPVEITSAYRCEKHNKAVGGSTNSQHVKGTATDIKVKGLTPSQVADNCEDFDGLGRYDSFTHLDSRGYKARWNFTKKT